MSHINFQNSENERGKNCAQDCSLAKRSITNNESPLEFKHSDIKHQLHFISKHICDQMQ